MKKILPTTLRYTPDLKKGIKKAAKANKVSPHKEALNTLNEKYLPK